MNGQRYRGHGSSESKGGGPSSRIAFSLSASLSTSLRAGLSAYSGDCYVRGVMMKAGAVGYLLKSEAPETIVAAVRAAARGEQLWTTEQFARARRCGILR